MKNSVELSCHLRDESLPTDDRMLKGDKQKTLSQASLSRRAERTLNSTRLEETNIRLRASARHKLSFDHPLTLNFDLVAPRLIQ